MRGHDRRRRLLAGIARTWPFPTRLVFRGLVVGARTLEAPVAQRGAAGQAALRVTKVQHFLEVVPEGLTPEAWGMLGSILVPTDRDLQEGSVVTVAVDMMDPSTYHLRPSGILTDLVEMKVDVAVER